MRRREEPYFGMPVGEFREWLCEVSSACEEHGARTMLMIFFSTLGFAEEFDHAWQYGVFDDWTWNPTPEHLEELVDVVRFGRY